MAKTESASSGVQDIAAIAWRCIRQCKDHEPPPVMCLKHQLEAEAVAARTRPQWQPIATAPKMRTILLFAVSDIAKDGTVRNWKMATGCWHTGYEDERSRAEGMSPWEWGGHQLRVYELHPTHWMPLPVAPGSEEVVRDE